MNEVILEPAQRALEERSRALFLESVEGLDMRMRSRLDQARQAAVAAARTRRRPGSCAMPVLELGRRRRGCRGARCCALVRRSAAATPRTAVPAINRPSRIWTSLPQARRVRAMRWRCCKRMSIFTTGRIKPRARSRPRRSELRAVDFAEVLAGARNSLVGSVALRDSRRLPAPPPQPGNRPPNRAAAAPVGCAGRGVHRVLG